MDRDDRENPEIGVPRDGADEAAGTEPVPETRQVPPVNRALARLERRLGGRPLAVYGVLLAGAAVLLILLAIIWLTAGGGSDDDGPICTGADATDAIALVKDGQIEGMDIVYPERDEADIEADPVLPTLLRLSLVDGSCLNLQPQGPSGEIEMYTVLGAVEWYNRTTEQRRIRQDFSESGSIRPEILATVTPTPQPTTPVVETPATPVAETPAPTATPPPTMPVVPPASPVASPVVSEEVTPAASPGA